MSIVPEEVTVWGTQCVQHPLSGSPEFTGLVDHPDGAFAEVRDGDLVLRSDDVPTLMRWASECSEAAVRLSHRQAEDQRERIADLRGRTEGQR